MTVKKAVGLAVKSMQKELQRFAFDASMYRDLGIDYAYGRRAAKHVEELKEAQGLLLALVQEKGEGGGRKEMDVSLVNWEEATKLLQGLVQELVKQGLVQGEVEGDGG